MLLQAMEVKALQILQLAMAQAVAVMPTGSGDIADMRKKVVYHGCLATFACSHASEEKVGYLELWCFW